MNSDLALETNQLSAQQISDVLGYVRSLCRLGTRKGPATIAKAEQMKFVRIEIRRSVPAPHVLGFVLLVSQAARKS